MKHSFLLSGFCVLVASSLCGAENLLPNPDFETKDPKQGWHIPDNYHFEEGVGRENSRALVWEETNANHYAFATHLFKIPEGGACYKFSGWAKVVEGENLRPCIDIEWSQADGKWLASCAATRVFDNDPTKFGWTRYEGITGLLPMNAARGSFNAFLPKGSVGKVKFDNFILEEVKLEPVEFLTSSAYKNTFVSGPVRFLSALNLNFIANKPEDYACTFTWKNAQGVETQKAIPLQDSQSVEFALNASDFALGEQTVSLALSLKGQQIGSRSVDITHLKTPLKRRFGIDEYGRFVKDGEPFFPLGLYTHSGMTEEDMKMWQEAPFNFTIQYCPPVKRELDKWAKVGTYVASDVRSWIYGYSYSQVCHLKSFEESKATFDKALKEIGDHPNFFMWYLVDEAPLQFVPCISAAQNYLLKADPDHPTYVLTDKPKDFLHLTHCGDALGNDCYPLGNTGKKPIGLCYDWATNVMALSHGFRPMLHVPQTFNWAWYGHSPQESWMPSRAEMANMFWQYVAGGANGLCGYAFYPFHQHMKGEEHDKTWADIVAVAKEVKSMEKVLLAVGPKLAVANPSAAIVTRAYNLKGVDYILLVNRTKEPATGTLKLPRSFKSLKACIGSGATLNGDTLELDFPALGYTFIELR